MIKNLPAIWVVTQEALGISPSFVTDSNFASTDPWLDISILCHLTENRYYLFLIISRTWCASIKIQITICLDGFVDLCIWLNGHMKGSCPEECKQVENTDIRGVKWKSCRGGPALIAFLFIWEFWARYSSRNLSFLFWKESMVASVWWGLREWMWRKSLALFVEVVVLFISHVSGSAC